MKSKFTDRLSFLEVSLEELNETRFYREEFNFWFVKEKNEWYVIHTIIQRDMPTKEIVTAWGPTSKEEFLGRLN